MFFSMFTQFVPFLGIALIFGNKHHSVKVRALGLGLLTLILVFFGIQSFTSEGYLVIPSSVSRLIHFHTAYVKEGCVCVGVPSGLQTIVFL